MKRLFPFLFFLLFLFSCSQIQTKKENIAVVDTSLSKVIKKRELRAIINYNSTDYYIDRGTPSGFQLDLLTYYCNYMNIKLVPIVKENTKEEFFALAKGEADLIIGDFNRTDLREMLFDFTIPHSSSPLVLVHRNNGVFLKTLPSGSHLNIHIPAHTSYADNIQTWEREHGMHVKIIFNSDYNSENLIERVSNSDIDYTVVEKKVAQNNARLLTNIDYSREISSPTDLSWVLPQSSDSLKNSIDLWLVKFKKTETYKNIYTRYYNTTYHPQILINRKSYSKQKYISKWDKYIKLAARKNQWDWKLYAALIYQESGFNPSAVGNGGSFGLLQLMPETARNYGIYHNSSPETQIMKGANYLKYLEKFYHKKVKSKEQLSKFVLASYNAGPGHVIDAINLTEKYGKDPTVWDKNVETYLKLKSVPKYYNDAVVKSGYYRGAFTTKFVDDVWERYHHYKNFVR